MAALLWVCFGFGVAEQAQTLTPAHHAQALAVIDLLRSHGLEMNSNPDYMSGQGKPWYNLISPSVNTLDPPYWKKKVTLKKVDASVYASTEQLTDLLNLMRNNAGFDTVSVGCGEAWVEKKATFVPGMLETILVAGNIEVRIYFENILSDDNPWTPEKEEWYERAEAEHPAALRALIAAIAADICRLGLDKPSSQPSANRPATGAAHPPADRPSEPPPVPKDPCITERGSLVVASLKARLSFSGVQSFRSTIEELNREWENRRQVAYWSGTLDIALMAGSVLTKPLASAIGSEIAKQSIKSAIIEATLKGMAKEGLKQYVKHCYDQGLGPPGEVLSEVASKGGKDLVKKGFQLFYEVKLTDMILEKTISGEMGGLELALASALGKATGGVDGTMLGGSSLPPAREFIRKEFAGPAAALLGVMISLQSAVDGAWTAHGKLESLRLAIGVLRDQEIVANERWRQAMEELDRTRSAFNYCQMLHPESPSDDETAAMASFRPETPAETFQPRRRVAEPETPPQPPASGGDSSVLILPFKSASLAVRDGSVIVAAITPDDIYYARQGLVAGSRLISINSEPFTARSLEDLRKLLNPPEKEMLVLEFLRPDGEKINLPIPVEK